MLWLLYRYAKMLWNLWSTSVALIGFLTCHTNTFSVRNAFTKEDSHLLKDMSGSVSPLWELTALPRAQVESFEQKECTSLPFRVPAWKA